MRSFLKQGMICFLAIFISLVSQAQQSPDRIFMSFIEASVNSDGYFSVMSGTATADDCLITGASTTCPQSIEGFSAPAGMVSYSWSITGNGFINGAANLDSVYIISSPICNGSYTLTLTITDESQQQFTCSKTVSVIDNTGPALTVPASIALQCTDPLPLMPLNINSSPNFITGTYNIGTAVFGAPLTSTPVTADAVLVNDGTGGAGNPYDACESIINDLTGKIAVIERSGCTPPASYFVTKAYKAQLAGAVGVIFIFNQPGDQVVTMGLPPGPNPTITIPLLLVSNNYGNTLKTELLAGPVNVSMSEQTVFVNDACSFAPINFTEEFVPGNCPSNYNVVRTWTATDQCGNTTSASQTITYADNTPPALTVPANLTLQCSDPLPLMPLNINSSPNFIEGTYNVGTAVFGAPLTATPLTADAVMVIDDAGNPYDACENITNNLSGKIAVIERSGCTPPASYFVTKAYKAQQAGAVGVIFIFNVPGNQVATMGLPPGPNPTITIPLMLVSNNYGNTLKAEILAGPVNVSLSAPTVIATDQCSFASITHQQTFTPGSCPSNYTLVNTWTATDQCGNATSASQTITVADNTAPTITVPADTTLQCTDQLPLMPLNINSSPNNIAGTYNIGTAVFGAPLTSTPVTADAVLVNDGIGGAGNPYDACESIINTLTGKIAVIERSGCTPPASYFVNKAYKAQLAGAVGVIFIFNQPGDNVVTMGLPPGPNPTITIPLMLVSNSYGNTLKAEILAGPVNVSMSEQTVIVNDTCSFASISFTETFTPGSCPANFNLIRTWTATDQCGNATSASQTITVVDTTPPVIIVPADTTLQCTDPLPLMPLNINSSPNNIAGTYNVGTAVFGAPLTSTPVTADAVLVNDGTGGAGNPYDACESIINDLTGKIAVIERSGCLPPASYFVNKAYKAQLAGAVGVIFIFNQPGDQVATMGLPPGPNPTITIPLLLVSNNYGNTLKAELLAGTVNVSMSEQTVFVNDACSFASISYSESFSPGSCPANYNLTRTWTATDQCGNASSASQTISIVDTTPPVITVPANITLQCNDTLPLMPLNINSSPNFINGTYNIGTAVFGAPLTATPVTADAVLVNDGTGGAGNPYDACESIINDLTGKIAVIERSGCTPPASYFVNKAYKAQLAGAVGVIFIFNQPGDQIVTMGLPPGPNPTITIPLMLVSNNYGNTLKAELLAGPVNVSMSEQTVQVNDECSFASISFTENFVPGNCPSNYSLVRTWTATDQCGNAASASQTITVVDNTPPALTVPANITLQCTDPLPLKPLEINSSPNFIDGTYNIGTAVFGAPLTPTPVTADAVLVNDGTGGAGNPYDACESIINDLTGKIAVIERSGCTPPASYFVNKAYKAQLAGAVGVIFIFNQPGNQVVTMGLPAGPNPTITIPLMLVSNSYGATLKSELLAGTVNVSLSAPTVIATDNCSFATITHQQTFTPGSCPSNYTLTNTWTATDQCGNATSASQTVTLADTTKPTLTVPANVTLQCTDPLPIKPLEINSSPNFIDGTYNIGTAVFGAPLTATPLTADAVMVIDDAGNPYDACENITNDLTGKVAVIERSGCTPPASYFVTKAYKAQQAGAVGVIFIFNAPGNQVATMGLPAGPNPTITIPLMLVSNSYGNTLKAEILAGPVNVSLSAPTVIATDNCSFATITHQQTFTPGSCPSNYTLVNTWTATDQCGNSTSASQTITVADNTAPTLTVPANVTLQCTDPLPIKPLEINSSPNFIDGTYNVGTAVFGTPLTSTPVTADAVLVNDGTGGAGNPYDACESIINDLTGKIAVIERSGCTPPASYFVNKAYKAQLAGAVGVIFISNQPGNYIFNMGLPAGPNPTITIPLMLVSNAYGAGLKSELLAGPVNVSLSAPTVVASDVCSFVAITHQQTFTPGGCGNNFTIVNTWTATDQCGNATTASQTVTSVDNTAPTLTVPANVTLQCNTPLPLEPLHVNGSPNSLASTYNVGTAIFGAPLTSTPVTANAIMVNDGTGGAGNPYDACESIINSLTGKIAVIERSGCTPPASYFVNKAYKAQLAGAVGVIFISNVPGNYVFNMGLPAGPNPTITIPLMLVSNNYGATLKAGILAGTVNLSLSAPTVIASDACSFVAITHSKTTTAGTCPSNYTITNTWTATDQCGNTSTASQTITVVDNVVPVVTCKANQTRLTGNGYCTYTASGSEFDVLSATDNCAGPVILSYTLSGATSGTGNNTLSGTEFNTGVTTVTWKATDGCGNFATCSFTVTVNDNQNNTNYIIYAKQQAIFDQNNFIGGDVGVSSTTGTAEFDKYDVLDPFKVRAKNITVKTPSSVNNRVYSAANDGPAPAFMVYNGNTSGLSNVTVSSNGVLNGNWKDVKVKKGVVVTINGNNFGVITIEEGATVTFGASLINMVELKVESGKKNVNKTRVIFNNPSSVKVKTKVTVEDDCLVNSGGPKVTFYLGDNNADEEKFRVKGNNSDITANIMIPNGKLKIDGGKADRPINMTGWFIIEKLEAGKYVYWNKYNCNNEEARPAFVSADNEPVKEAAIEVQEIVVQPSVDEFRVNAYPNPSAYDFGIMVYSKSNEPIQVRILDASGRVYGTSRTVTKGTVIKLGSELKSGTYFAEVVQGNNRKTVKLIKLN